MILLIQYSKIYHGDLEKAFCRVDHVGTFCHVGYGRTFYSVGRVEKIVNDDIIHIFLQIDHGNGSLIM